VLTRVRAAFVACLSLIPSVYTQTAIPSNGLPVGSCTASIPCANGACCNGKSGFCGFGPSFCGSGNCTSNCNAQAECGYVQRRLLLYEFTFFDQALQSICSA
jgi:hypothetical protein